MSQIFLSQQVLAATGTVVETPVLLTEGTQCQQKHQSLPVSSQSSLTQNFPKSPKCSVTVSATLDEFFISLLCPFTKNLKTLNFWVQKASECCSSCCLFKHWHSDTKLNCAEPERERDDLLLRVSRQQQELGFFRNLANFLSAF